MPDESLFPRSWYLGNGYDKYHAMSAFWDCILVIGESATKLPIHKTILIARSGLCRSSLEAQPLASGMVLPKIENKEVMETVISFIYSDEFLWDMIQSVPATGKLLAAAAYMDIEDLVKAADAHFCKLIEGPGFYPEHGGDGNEDSTRRQHINDLCVALLDILQADTQVQDSGVALSSKTLRVLRRRGLLELAIQDVRIYRLLEGGNGVAYKLLKYLVDDDYINFVAEERDEE